MVYEIYISELKYILEVLNNQMFNKYWGITVLQQQIMWLENKNEN